MTVIRFTTNQLAVTEFSIREVVVMKKALIWFCFLTFLTANGFAQTPKNTKNGTNKDSLSLELAYKPFNPRHTIDYSIPRASHVKLAIRDGQGNEIKTIVDSFQEAGSYHIQCDLEMPASGVYYCNLLAGNTQCTHSIAFLKVQENQ